MPRSSEAVKLFFRFPERGRAFVAKHTLRILSALTLTLLLTLLSLSPPAVLASSPEDAPTQAPSLQIDADRVIWRDGIARGEGRVRLEMGGYAITASSFGYEPARCLLELEHGELNHADGILRFEHASARDGLLHLEHLRWTTSSGRWILDAEQFDMSIPSARPTASARKPLSILQKSAPGERWVAHGLWASPCGCAPAEAPWSVRARALILDPGQQQALLLGGLIQAGELPLLPVPIGLLPMGRRQSGFLPPDLAWTPEGAEFALPLYLVTGPSSDLSLEPAFRQQRGFRLGSHYRAAHARAEETRVLAGGGFDALEGRWRGYLDAESGLTPGRGRVALDASVLSDLDYLGNYSPDFLTRQLPFQETRALAGLGGLRLEHQSFQSAQVLPQQILGLRWVRAATDPGRASAWTGLGVEQSGLGTDLLHLDESWTQVHATQGLLVRSDLGPSRGQARAWVQGASALSSALDPIESALGQAAVELDQALPLWGRHRGVLHVLSPSLVAGAATHTQGELSSAVSAGSVALLPEWWAGPRLESLWIGPDGIPLHLTLEVPWTAEGLKGAGQLWARQGPWGLRAQVALDALDSGQPAFNLGNIALTHEGERLDAELQLLHADTTLLMDQAVASLARSFDLRGHALRPGAGLRLDLRESELIEERLSLDWVHARRCLGLRLSASFAQDREWPELGLSLQAGPDVRPR